MLLQVSITEAEEVGWAGPCGQHAGEVWAGAGKGEPARSSCHLVQEMPWELGLFFPLFCLLERSEL